MPRRERHGESHHAVIRNFLIGVGLQKHTFHSSRESWYFGFMFRKLLGVVLLFLLTSAEICVRADKPFVQPEDLGGMKIYCVGVTDRMPEAISCIYPPGADGPESRACGCRSKMTEFPTAGEDGVPMGVISSALDLDCTTIGVVGACIPNTIPVDLGFPSDPLVFDHRPAGQYPLREHLASTTRRQYDLVDIDPSLLYDGGGASDGIAETKRKFDDVVAKTCGPAYFGAWAAEILGETPFTPGWGSTTKNLTDTHLRQTQFIDQEQVIGNAGDWARDDAAILPGTLAGTRTYMPNGAPDFCNGGQEHPFGFTASPYCRDPTGQNCSPGSTATVRNAPTNPRIVDPACPAGDCDLANRSFALEVNPAASAATITASNADGDPAAVQFSGALSVAASNCRPGPVGGTVCDAEATVLLAFGGFELSGQKVASMSLQGGLSEGAIIEDSFGGAFSGETQITLEDGRYAKMQFKRGPISVVWTPEDGSMKGYFRFDGTLGKADFVIEGTIHGRILNTSPVAVAELVPASTDNQYECGETVELSALASLDDDGDDLHYSWHEVGVQTELSTNGVVAVELSELGGRAFHLAVYDKLGLRSEDAVALEVVDTLPPSLEVDGRDCIWPPNSKEMLLRLGDEIRVSASDGCEGRLDESVRILDAYSNSEGARVGLLEEGVCVGAERDATYTIVLAVDDGNGNTMTKEHTVVVPHDRRDAKDCFTHREVPTCMP